MHKEVVAFVFPVLRLACQVKKSEDDNLKRVFSLRKTGFDISGKLLRKQFDISCTLSPKETVCMKCQEPIFLGK